MREFIGVSDENIKGGIIKEIGAKGFVIMEGIAAYSDFDTRQAIVSIERLAYITGMGYSTATRTINDLVERGYITKQIIPTRMGLRPMFKLLDERFELIRLEEE